MRAQAQRAVWTDRPGWVAMPKYHNVCPIAPGQPCRPTSSSGVPWVSGCSGDGIRDLQASPGGPGAVGGGNLYTSRLLLLVTSEPWGHKIPTPDPRVLEKRARGTHFTPPAFPRDKRHESLTKDLYFGVMSDKWGPYQFVGQVYLPRDLCLLSNPETPIHPCPAQGASICSPRPGGCTCLH